MASKDISRPADGGNLDGSNPQVFTFDPPAPIVFLQSHPDSGPTLYGKVEANEAAVDDWDFVLVPGQAHEIWQAQEQGAGITQIALYADQAATYETDFVVYGRG